MKVSDAKEWKEENSQAPQLAVVVDAREEARMIFRQLNRMIFSNQLRSIVSIRNPKPSSLPGKTLFEITVTGEKGELFEQEKTVISNLSSDKRVQINFVVTRDEQVEFAGGSCGDPVYIILSAEKRETPYPSFCSRIVPNGSIGLILKRKEMGHEILQSV